ncbi:MAG: chloramphenicol phosphotransferase [Capsulimonas sp.]|jgi:chloramphenicol 3-O phosphotransferase|nr:chloramphenicol phosphotransferase [Capsulimonas sp.]
MRIGRVLFLQGASSAGKSTLATALQRNLDEYWWALEADDITRMQPTGERTGWWEPTPEERSHPSWNDDLRLSHWLSGYFGCLATIARTGSNVIAVGGWLQTSWLRELAATLEGIDSLCVGVFCPLDELERREIARGDRRPGYARSHYDIVHTHTPYDVHVDTALQTTDESVASIKMALASPPELPFFAHIRVNAASDGGYVSPHLRSQRRF